jgi:hypothetical protein
VATARALGSLLLNSVSRDMVTEAVSMGSGSVLHRIIEVMNSLVQYRFQVCAALL